MCWVYVSTSLKTAQSSTQLLRPSDSLLVLSLRGSLLKMRRLLLVRKLSVIYWPVYVYPTSFHVSQWHTRLIYYVLHRKCCLTVYPEHAAILQTIYYVFLVATTDESVTTFRLDYVSSFICVRAKFMWMGLMLPRKLGQLRTQTFWQSAIVCINYNIFLFYFLGFQAVYL